MKSLSLLAVVLAAALIGGCSGGNARHEMFATPAYSASERNQLIARNWNYEGAMLMDDVDSLLLLRPASRLTIWHVR